MAMKKPARRRAVFFAFVFVFCGSGVSREADSNTAFLLSAIASMQFAGTTGFAAYAAPTKSLFNW